MSKSTFVAIVIAGLTAGCSTDTVNSKDVNEETLWQRYSVMEFAESGKQEVWVEFRVGGGTGTTVELSESESLKLNNVDLKKGSKFLGTEYRLSLADQDKANTFAFEWTTKSGKKLKNQISLKRAEIVEPKAETHFSIATLESKGLTVTYAGDDVSKEDWGSCHIRYPRNGSEPEWVIYGDIDRQDRNCVIREKQNVKFRKGKATVHFELRARAAMQEKFPPGGQLDASYFAKPVHVTVVE